MIEYLVACRIVAGRPADDRTTHTATTANGTDPAHDMRSYYNYSMLPRPAATAVTGSSTGQQQQAKRNSISPDANSLRPASAGDASPRRNSCTGIVQSASCSLPLSPPRPSSRRNSAVTYLPDMHQGRSRSAHRSIIQILLETDLRAPHAMTCKARL